MRGSETFSPPSLSSESEHVSSEPEALSGGSTGEDGHDRAVDGSTVCGDMKTGGRRAWFRACITPRAVGAWGFATTAGWYSPGPWAWAAVCDGTPRQGCCGALAAVTDG